MIKFFKRLLTPYVWERLNISSKPIVFTWRNQCGAKRKGSGYLVLEKNQYGDKRAKILGHSVPFYVNYEWAELMLKVSEQ